MDLNDIINTLIAEANGEGPEGMRRVGETILNRAAIRGLDPAAVVRQPHQYTGYFAPGPAAIAAQRDPKVRTAAEAAWELARQPGDPTGGADHYKANYVSPSWADQMPQTGSYGAHDFYRSRQVPAEALARLLAPSAPTPAMPSAAINAMRSPMFNGDPLTPANGPVVASFSTRPVAASSLFGDDPGTPANGPVVARIPTTPQVSASDRARGNSGIKTIATYPTSGIGQPPATRVVASVPVPAPSKQTESRSDPVGIAPKFNDIASMFGQNIPGPSGTTAVKTQDRLPSTAGPRANASAPGPALFGGLDPNLVSPAPTPFSASDAARARAPKPTTKTVTERVINPAWTAAQQAAKIDPVGSMPSWGDFASTFAPKPAAPMPSQYINVTKQVPVAAPKVAPVPLTRPASLPGQKPLQVVVNGGNVQQPKPAPSNWAPQGYTNDGTGKITSNETGGVYYERHLR